MSTLAPHLSVVDKESHAVGTANITVETLTSFFIPLLPMYSEQYSVCVLSEVPKND